MTAIPRPCDDDNSNDSEWESYPIRSYNYYPADSDAAATDASTKWTIVDTIMAATAAPMFFPAHRRPGDPNVYVDAGICDNNPCIALKKDILWPHFHRHVGLIVSIGTGGTSRVTAAHNLRGLYRMSKKAISDTRRLEELASKEYGQAFFSLQIKKRLHRISLDDSSRLSEMKVVVQEAMNSTEMAKKLEDIASLYGKISNREYLGAALDTACDPVYCLAT